MSSAFRETAFSKSGMASSPRFKQQYPAVAAAYLAKANLGWQFLMNAIAKNGKAGAYQKITHYGDDFTHNDELAWAAMKSCRADSISRFLARSAAM